MERKDAINVLAKDISINSGSGIKISALRKSIDKIDQMNLRNKRLEPLEDKSLVNLRLGESSLDRLK